MLFGTRLAAHRANYETAWDFPVGRFVCVEPYSVLWKEALVGFTLSRGLGHGPQSEPASN